jgi:hypothetical protein
VTEIPISPEIWKLAQAILTERQYAVLELREKRGFSWHQLAVTFNSTRSTVREHHRAATKNMLDAIENAGGDIDLALERANPTVTVGMETNRVAFVQPRPTPEEKHETDARPTREADPQPLVRDSLDRRPTPILDGPGEKEIA